MRKKIKEWVVDGNVNLWALSDYDGVVDMLMEYEENREEILRSRGEKYDENNPFHRILYGEKKSDPSGDVG